MRVEVSHRGLFSEDLMIYTDDGDQINKKLRGIIVGEGETTKLPNSNPVTLPTVWFNRQESGFYLWPGQYLVRASVRYSPDIYGIPGTSYDYSDAYELTIGPPLTPTPAPLRPDRACGPYTLDLPCGPGVELGKAYSFTIYTHCGVRRAYFDGRDWIIEPELSDGNGNPPPGWRSPVDTGTMALVAENLARYTSASGAVAEFRPLAEGEEYPFRSCF